MNPPPESIAEIQARLARNRQAPIRKYGPKEIAANPHLWGKGPDRMPMDHKPLSEADCEAVSRAVSAPPAPRKAVPGVETAEKGSKSLLRGTKRAEIAEHETLMAWLRLHEWPFIRARSDQKSTIRKGWADFTVFHAGRCAAVEMKAPGNKPTLEQEQVLAELRREQIPVTVAYSAQEAIEFLRAVLG